MPRRLLAVIPARSGSKRLPGKNIRLLGGIPLIGWTIRAAAAAGVFDQLLVSTDDQEIAEIAIRFGASAPWLRPEEFSSDTATSVDVVLHALNACEANGKAVDSVMLLQPTSPFRSVDTIRRAVSLHDHAGKVPVVSVCLAKSHPAWCFKVDNEGSMQGYVGDSPLQIRSQDLPTAYQLNGSIYLATAQDLRSERSFITTHARALVVKEPEESIDIDDAFDWRVAECLASSLPLLGG